MANMSRLSNKVAIMTGASKGIGSGIARALGAAGARVAANYSSDREGAERVAQAITDNRALPGLQPAYSVSRKRPYWHRAARPSGRAEPECLPSCRRFVQDAKWRI